tara:strand:+ start:1048 stop:2616 length:1569 start_codon:yes stop_codon:yes gene_type:complete
MPNSNEQAKVNEQLEITKQLLEDISTSYKKISSNTQGLVFEGNKMVATAQAEFEARAKKEKLTKGELESLKSTGKSLGMIEEVYKTINDDIDGIIDGSVKMPEITKGFLATLKANTGAGGQDFLSNAAIEAEKLLEVLGNPATGQVWKAVDKGAGKLESMIGNLPGGNFLMDQFNIGPKIREAAGDLKGDFLQNMMKGKGAMGSLVKSTKFLKIGLAAVAVAAAGFALEVNKAQRDLGTSFAQTSKILATSKAVAAVNKANGMTQEDTLSIIKGIASEFGSFSDATTSATLQASNLVANYGLAADSVGTLARNIQTASGGTLDSALNSAELFGNMARTADVPVGEVMNDIAKSTELFAKFGQDGGTNIAAAAISAKKLGLELSNVASIANSLLNFEDSIQKQMEAEVLLGKELNLEKAREMVFNNDIAGAMEEISQLVSPEEFQAMDAVRREALAAATGLDAAAMARAINAGGAGGGGITSAMRTGGAPAGGGGTDKMDMLITTVQEGNANMVRAVQGSGVG